MIDLRLGDCRELLQNIETASIDAIITDSPYAEIDRPYGRLTEMEWWDLMMIVCKEARRILKPTGSAVFIIQPNSKHIGQMRGWVFEFMAWVCREWNMVQDIYWWNTTALPLSVAIQGKLTRASLKPCVWAGEPNCYRNQDNVLWGESERNNVRRKEKQYEHGRIKRPSVGTLNEETMIGAAELRGGVTPFNVLPIPNADSVNSAGANGHGAGTPLELAKWWTRYIVPTSGVVLDPFMGSGTMGLAALEYGDSFVGIEKDTGYFEIAERRIVDAQKQMTMELTT